MRETETSLAPLQFEFVSARRGRASRLRPKNRRMQLGCRERYSCESTSKRRKRKETRAMTPTAMQDAGIVERRVGHVDLSAARSTPQYGRKSCVDTCGCAFARSTPPCSTLRSVLKSARTEYRREMRFHSM